LALLAHPDSGSGEAEEVEADLRARMSEVESFGLDQREAVASWHPDRIAVAAGDGAIGAAAEIAAELAVPLAVIPVGTANDFARAVGVPRDRTQATEVALRSPRTKSLDLAFAEDREAPDAARRPFVNAASAGLSPAAARRAGSLKGPLGPLAYTVGAMRAALASRPVASRVDVDGVEVFAGSAWQVTVACTGAFGGGAEVEADPRDGVLDVVVLEGGSRARLLAHAYGLRRGNVERGETVRTAEGRTIEVDADGEGFNLDGELLEARRLRFTVRARAFELVVA
jgi:diacylglycerol kinase family enzyme